MIAFIKECILLYKLKFWHKRRLEILTKIVNELYPKYSPYHYGVAPSFLQTKFDPEKLIFVDVMFPNIPLVVDILDPTYAEDFNDAKPFVTRETWESNRGQQAKKRLILSTYGCPYLVIKHNDSTDMATIKEKITSLTGQTF